MAALFVGSQPVFQVLAALGVGALLLIAGCLLLDSLLGLLDGFRRLGLACKVGVLFTVAQLALFGGAKHGGTNDVTNVDGTNVVTEVSGTNEVGEAESGEAESFPLQGEGLRGPLPSGRPSQSLISGKDSASPLSVTDILPELSITDIARGYRLESVATNDNISYALPSGATVRGTWHLTGAYEDVQKVRLGDFLFPLGTNLCSSLWTYTWGKVRPQLRNTVNEIAAVGAPMSAIPDTSRFWTMLTANDKYLMTWENFAAGRVRGEAVSSPLQDGITPPLTSGEDTASPLLNAQIELHRNGDFITRSNNVESVYRRVIEPNPEPLDPYGPVQDLSVINETNAYCWVDIVVNNADAWVRFEGDGPSNLADPSFAAKVGETNHVVILIGKTYKVTCDMQFSIVGKSDPAIDAWWEDDHTLWLNWPVEITALDDGGGPRLLSAGLRLMGAGSAGKSFTMSVDPDCLGGAFAWTNSCCSVSGSGTRFSYSCDGHCYCTGCAANGYYSYEGYRIGCHGGWCGCSYVPGEWEGHDDPYDVDPAPSVSVWFEDDAVIFEDAYTNMPGEVVERSSTRTVLHLVAHGGMKGGTATFSFENRDKLVGFDIPTSLDVPAGHCKSYRFTYSGRSPSGSENDIKVHGEFQENNAEEDSESLTSDAELTSVKVCIEALHTALDNPNKNRHVYGVGEEASLTFVPASCVTRVSASFGLLQDPAQGQSKFTAPDEEDTVVLVVECGGVQKWIALDVFEPDSYVVQTIDATFHNAPNEAGLIEMHFTNRIFPTSVSFYAIEVTEIPMVSTDPVGYFAQPEHSDRLDHGKHGAYGQWSRINEDNSTTDEVAMGYCEKPWNGGGSYSWPIPNAWRIARDPCSTNVFIRTDQRFELDADGTARVSKFGWTGERGTNDTHRVYASH